MKRILIASLLVSFMGLTACGNGTVTSDVVPSPTPDPETTPSTEISCTSNVEALSISAPTTTCCNNGTDDDQDGKIDCDDTDCVGQSECDTTPTTSDDVDQDGFSVAAGDCDDNNASAFPGANEVAANSIDDDCDGNVDEPSATQPETICNDGIDSDGDDLTDCADTDCAAAENCSETPDTGGSDHVDNDHDGFKTPRDCNDSDAAINPRAHEIANDGIDQNCDGHDRIDADNDGISVGRDCNDADPTIHPGAAEVANDGIDQDCNGSDQILLTPITDQDNDGDGYSVGITRMLNRDCDDNDASIHPGATEIVNDGIDQDCNGSDMTGTDADGDHYTVEGGDCDDTSTLVNPGMSKDCHSVSSHMMSIVAGYSGIDNDCDGTVDEDGDCTGGITGLPEVGPITAGTDSDGDGYKTGILIISNEDCDDNDASIHPGATEVRNDGIDQDCDGSDSTGITLQPGSEHILPGVDGGLTPLNHEDLTKSGSVLWRGFYFNISGDNPTELHSIGFNVNDITESSASDDQVNVDFQTKKTLSLENNMKHHYRVKYMAVEADKEDIRFYTDNLYYTGTASSGSVECKSKSINTRDLGMDNFDTYAVVIRGFNTAYSNNDKEKHFKHIGANVKITSNAKDNYANIGKTDSNDLLKIQYCVSYYGADTPSFDYTIYLTLIGFNEENFAYGEDGISNNSSTTYDNGVSTTANGDTSTIDTDESIDDVDIKMIYANEDSNGVVDSTQTIPLRGPAVSSITKLISGLKYFALDCVESNKTGSCYDAVDELGFYFDVPTLSGSDAKLVRHGHADLKSGSEYMRVMMSSVVIGANDNVHMTVKSGEVKADESPEGSEEVNRTCSGETWTCQ